MRMCWHGRCRCRSQNSATPKKPILDLAGYVLRISLFYKTHALTQAQPCIMDLRYPSVWVIVTGSYCTSKEALG